MIDLQRILDAQSLLARHFGPTPIARAASLSSPTHDTFLKIETGLPTGSFKVRGALHALSLNLAAGAVREVVCASTGNHGAAVAWAAQLLGIRATIFLPANPNPVKADRIRTLGARLVESGTDLSDAIDAADAYAAREGAFFLHDARDPDVPVGAGTIGLEIVDQLPDVDTIYVPMGDTALIRGVASAVKQRRPTIRIVGVVAERAPAYLRSWENARRAEKSGRRAESSGLRADAVVETATCDTIADGLAIRRPLAPNVAAIVELVDDVLMVSEEDMIAAIERLYAQEQVIAEPAGAAAAAAVLKRPTDQGTIAALVTGGNITPELRKRLVRDTV
ncbi:MAG TPA: pyridoxal-phosphate dependent enzyme [Vicinamibacterales bacterium]|nr:pyridoxal-phosphate dependent enzyme [Vicinamibacterales bacterium]